MPRIPEMRVDNVPPPKGIVGISRAFHLKFDTYVVVHGSIDPLLTAKVPLGCLDRNVAQRELDLL